ncbi:MAG: TonB-dependent receptor plug domain-containing protein, partial [Caulobacterales bacterium]|nr:TonB-dependent receptor plug domain-containing protein [Caulobacterales bacterium]
MAILTGAGYAYAQDAEPEERELDRIVVTGTTRSDTTALNSTVAITTATAAELAREAPLGIADSLELVPGFWVEDSGGEISNNVAPRGLGGGSAFRFISIQEDGLPVLYDGSQVDSLQRQDITIDRFEAIRGGTSAILSANGPASIVNYISRRGTEDPEGVAKLTVSDYNTVRGELFYGAPVNDDWLIGVGGYYRASDGVRDTQFTADHGGQIRLNLTRKLAQGELTIHAKAIEESNTFFLPIPLQGVGDPEGIPGFDPNYGTMLSADNARIEHLTPDGVLETDLRDGFQTTATTIGSSFDWDFDNGWSFQNKNRATFFDLEINAIFNFSNDTLFEAEERLLADDVTSLVASTPGAVGAAYFAAGTGEALGDGSTLNGNGLTTESIGLFRNREIEQFVNDARFVHETDRNSLAVGLLYFSSHLERDFVTANTFASEVTDNPRRLDIAAVDANGDPVAFLTDNGVQQYGTWFGNHAGDLKSYNFYANDEFEVTEDLRVNVGVRYETVEYSVVSEDVASNVLLPGALAGDGSDIDNILAN